MDIMSHIHFLLGCGEEKEPTEAQNNDLEPTARIEKYITSIMDEESSRRGGHTHARIKIHKNNCEARKGGPVVDNHCVYHEGLEGTQIWNILLS